MQNTWAHSRLHFEIKVKATEDYTVAGNQTNTCVTTNTATEMGQKLFAETTLLGKQNKVVY